MVKINYPAAIAPEIARPSAADFPRPRAASKATVLRSVFSKIASRNVITAFAYADIVIIYKPRQQMLLREMLVNNVGGVSLSN